MSSNTAALVTLTGTAVLLMLAVVSVTYSQQLQPGCTASKLRPFIMTANAPVSSVQSRQQLHAHPTLFVGVLSAAKNAAARQAVRDTWGSDSRIARIMFVVLLPKSNATLLQLQAEAVGYSDLTVVHEVAEDYKHLTYATLTVFRAAAALGPHIQYVMKTDDDCYIRLPLLMKSLASAPRMWAYAGWPMSERPIPRPPSKWGIPTELWPSNASVVYGYGGELCVSMFVCKHVVTIH